MNSSHLSSFNMGDEPAMLQTNVPGFNEVIQNKTPQVEVSGHNYREFVTPKLSVCKSSRHLERRHPRRCVGSTSCEHTAERKCNSAPSTPVRPSSTLQGNPVNQDIPAMWDGKDLYTQESVNHGTQHTLEDFSVPATSQPYPGYVGYIRQPEPVVTSNYSHQNVTNPSDGQTPIPNIAVHPIHSHMFVPTTHVHSTAPPVGLLATSTFPSHMVTNAPSSYQMTSTPMSATMPHLPLDLLDWQVHHQQQLRRQQLDATKNMYPVSVATPSFLEATSGANDPHKWDSLKRVTDSIVKEKDMIIDRQKLKIQQMEHRFQETDLQLKHVLRLRAEESGDKMAVRLQEMQYDNASLHAKLIDLETDKAQQIEALRSQLGATEYDLEKIQANLNDRIDNKEKEIENLKQKLEVEETSLSEWKRKHSELKEAYSLSKKKVKSLERYLMDLPSPDEYSDTNRRLATLESDYSQSQTSLLDLEQVLKEAQSQIVQKDEHISQLEEQERDLVARFERMEVELDGLKEKLKERTLSVVEQENEALKVEGTRLAQDVHNAKQMLDAQHKKIQQLEGRHQSEMACMQERLADEEAMSLALRQEVQSKENELGQVRSAMKQVVDQNQALMENSAELKERCKEFEKLMSAEHHQLEQKLHRDLTLCFTDLQALVNVCMQQAEGQEPNMSVLLGVRALSLAEQDEEEEGVVASQALKMRLAKVHGLQKEIDRLRQMVSNKYAEEMGANISCAQQ